MTDKRLDRMIELFNSYDWGLLPLMEDEKAWDEFQLIKLELEKELEKAKKWDNLQENMY